MALRTVKDEMRREIILKNLREEFNVFSQLNYHNKDDFYQILYKKIHECNLPVRANISVALYDYLMEEHTLEKNDTYNYFFKRQFPFILEAIISIQYYHNQILDDKSGVNIPTTINNNLIAGNLLKEQLYRYIENVNLPQEHIMKLFQYVRLIFEAVDVGQYIEKNHNTYEAFKKKHFRHPFERWMGENINSEVIKVVVKTTAQFMDEEHSNFIKLYAERIFLVNSILFVKLADFMTDLLNIPQSTRESLHYFNCYFGICYQIVNDNSDFVPSSYKEKTTGKCYQDALSDLKNKNLTLPIFVHLCRNPAGKTAYFLEEMERSEFGRLCLMPEQEKAVYNEIIDSLSIYHAMKIPKLLKEKAIKYLNEHNSNYNTLLSIISIVDNNRFYKHFYNQKEQYKKYKKEIKKMYLQSVLI